MSDLPPTAQQSQQLAMKALAQADACTIIARQRLEDISPLMKNSSVYEQLLKLSKTINDTIARVNGLTL